MNDTLTLEIWSDVICPWCWIGKRRLESALAAFPHRDQVRIVHRAYRLMPGAPVQPSRAVLAQKLGSPQQMAAMLAHVEAEAAKEGLEYHLADGWVGDTLALHRLIKYAANCDLGEVTIERFYRAGFTEQLPIFERATQLRLASEIGLDPDDVEAVLDGQVYLAEVEADQRALQATGGNGVPFFLIGGKYTISGAQPQEVFIRALQQAWNARPVAVAAADGNVCGPDGCVIPGAG